MANPSPATLSTTRSPPPVEAEPNSSPPPPRLSEPSPVIKQEQQLQLAITTNPPTEPQQKRQQQKQQQKQPHFLNYVAGLRNLSPALSAFHRRYDELHEHLDFIKSSIDAQLLQILDTDAAPTPDVLGQSDVVPAVADVVPAVADVVPAVDEVANSEKQTTDINNDDKDNKNQSSSSQSEIEALCKTMCFRGLRRYIISNLDKIPKLRKEVPAALKLASNPAKLVLDCFGRFFLQGIRAYSKNSPMIPSRKASILVLEYYLLSGIGSGEIEAAVKQEGWESAVDWRKRLITEGGLDKACEVDARGLLLLIGCFGIPKDFRNEDIRDLVRASNAIKISDALRRSNVLVTRIPEVIEWMMKNKMEVEAVDITYTFGMESRFLPGKILKSFLQLSKETCKKARNEAHGSLASVNKANKRQLADLKDVVKCLKGHKMDPAEVLHGWQINEKVSKLERVIADLDKKIREQVKSKRKAEEAESSKKMKSPEVKRSRFADRRPEEQNTAAYVDGMGSYEGLAQRNSLDGGIPQPSAYSGYISVIHGGGVGPSPGIGASDILPPRSYAGVHGGILVDRVVQHSSNAVQPYGWHGGASLNERLVGHSYAYAEPSALGVSGLYRAAPPVEGFAGLPNPSSVGVSHRSSTSDLYQFADAVVDRETYTGSRTGATIPPRVASAHHSAYYYGAL